ncbi:PP2C family protein-serine/threonine phosphatase [Methylobacterium sp. D48H]
MNKAPKGSISSVYGSAIQGTRNEQEDSFEIIELEENRSKLLVLADGMGGHACGRLASSVAVSSFCECFLKKHKAQMPASACLEQALEAANLSLSRFQDADPNTRGMGTTLVAAYATRTDVIWISVGDSPLWLCRSNRLYRLNEDHSLRAMSLGRTTDLSNMLQSALTGDIIPLIDICKEPLGLSAGDQILLASDGVMTLSDNEIIEVIARHPSGCPETKVNDVLSTIERKGKSNQDNSTIVIYQINENASNGFAMDSVIRHPIAALLIVLSFLATALILLMRT